jgi:hypothetical protein
MHEAPKADRSPVGGCWQPVFIAEPRRLDRVATYSVIVKRDGREETIADNATIARALVIALEYGGYGAAMFYRDRGTLREYIIGRRRLGGNPFEAVLRGVVPRTARIAIDHVHALEFFEEIFADDPRLFFDGRLEIARGRARRRRDVTGEAT